MKFQKYIDRFLFKNKKKQYSLEDLKFSQEISSILGFHIKNIELYKEALSVKVSVQKKNYERLEFLGDAILGSIISSYLFIHYPKANEGYMTQLKSKIVNRKNLNKLGEELGLLKFIDSKNSGALGENISGNLLEAMIGAVFLDTDYENCRKFVLEKILPPKLINHLENKVASYKSLLLEWTQKEKRTLRYETSEVSLVNNLISFRSIVWLDEMKIANASEASKKKAEEKAAQRAFYILNKKHNIIEKDSPVS